MGEIALIGSRGLDAVRLTTRWTDQVYVIHELPVGRDGDFGKTDASLLFGFAGGFSSGDLEQVFEGGAVEIAGPGRRVAFTHTFGFRGGAMRCAARRFRSLRFDCVLPDDERDGGGEKDRSNRGGDGFRSELQAAKGTGGRMRQ
jgi:hypothetical protein